MVIIEVGDHRLFILESEHLFVHEFQTDVDKLSERFIPKSDVPLLMERALEAKSIIQYNMFYLQCPIKKCRIPFQENFEYCPYCGEKI